MPADLYDVLGVSDDAAAEELKRAYRGRVRKYHPDQNDHPDGDAQFKLVKTAHDVLSDPAERKTYDRLGHREYVEKHLDDLPPVSVFPDEELPDGTSTDDGSTDGEASTTGTADTSTAETSTAATGTSSSTGSTDTGPSRSRDGYGTDTSSSGSSTADRSSTGSASSADTSSASTGSATSSSSSTGSADDGGTTTAGADRSSWDAATNSAQSAASESTVPEGVRRRRGLKRWYGVVALSLLVYLGGLGAYALPRQAELRAFVSDVASSPAGTLLGAFPLASPSEYVLRAVGAATSGVPELGLVLLAGTVLLPLVVLTAVGRFGRGAAWVYALPSLAPAICLGVWSAVAVPTWAALLGLIVLPVLSGGGFLVDVGRYLRATR